MIKGFFELKTPEDLLKKLRYDLQQMELHPFDTYLAFNFFVTAEALPDWCFPGKPNSDNRKKMRNTNVYTKITSDLASGAKHFSQLADFHDSVDQTVVSAGWFPRGSFPIGAFPPAYMGNGALFVYLKDPLSDDGEKVVSALDLARNVLDFWETEISHRSVEN